MAGCSSHGCWHITPQWVSTASTANQDFLRLNGKSAIKWAPQALKPSSCFLYLVSGVLWALASWSIILILSLVFKKSSGLLKSILPLMNQFGPPGLMVQIPRNGHADAGFKGEGRVVSKVCGYFVRVDGVAAVVAGPVGDMGDERSAGGSFGWWCLGESFCQGGICFKQVVKDCADQVDDVQVDLFIVAADIVGFSDFALVQDQVNAQSCDRPHRASPGSACRLRIPGWACCSGHW